MTEPRLIQNFSGCHALLVAGAATNTDVLADTLGRLGVVVRLVTPAQARNERDIVIFAPDRDIIFIDVDLDDALDLPFSRIGQRPPAPMIGLIGVEAPSRLKALMQAGGTAFLRKPVHGGAVYSALFLGINGYRRRRHLELAIEGHERRRRGRCAVIKAVLLLMRERGVDDDEAYSLLRRQSMKQRQTLEELCESLIRRSGGKAGVEEGDFTQRLAD